MLELNAKKYKPTNYNGLIRVKFIIIVKPLIPILTISLFIPLIDIHQVGLTHPDML